MPRPLIVSVALLVVLAACSGSGAGSPLKEGRSVYGNVCSACHGDAGQGGVGPELAGLTETFPLCADQIEWITLGSEEWKRSHGDTYGALDKPVAGGMPSHAKALTPAEIASVAAWERSTYGGVSEEDAIDQCGVVFDDD